MRPKGQGYLFPEVLHCEEIDKRLENWLELLTRFEQSYWEEGDAQDIHRYFLEEIHAHAFIHIDKLREDIDDVRRRIRQSPPQNSNSA